MTALTIKKYTATRFLGFLLSIIYGFLVIAALQRLYAAGGADVNNYAIFDFAGYVSNEFSIRTDGLFRLGINLLLQAFNVEVITVFSFIAFMLSSIFFTIYLINIRSEKYLILILPLFLMVFFTPMVTYLFASTIRSSLAFTVFMVALIYSKGFTRYILFGLSSLIHLALIPVISLYFLFHTLNRIKMRSTFIIPLSLLFLSTFLIVIAANLNQFNISVVSKSFYFNFLIFCLALLMIFTNKKAMQNIYGFLSIGLILIYFSGLIIDISFFRYVPYSIILYLYFLIEKGELGTIQVFSFGYVPFFILTLLYEIAGFA